jgi:hypothetical protein
VNVHLAESEEKDIVPIDLQTYLDLDLAPDGVLAQNLLSRADAEASLDEIRLSQLNGPQPADITPEMVDWYQMYVGGARSRALYAVAALFKERCDPARGEGFLPQTRLGSLEENLLKGKLKTYKDHNESNVATSDRIRDLEKQIVKDENRYDIRKAELGRDAKPTNQTLYLLVLIFVLFGSEAALNLDAFKALPWSTPAIAWGATIVIGLAIGLAAHYHGMVLKQYGYYFDASEDDTKRGPALRMFAGGTLALSVALSFIYYARSAYFESYLGSVSSFGQSSGDANFLWVVGGSLLGNVLVYLTGTLWAYMMHDIDPEFVDLKESLDKAKKEAGALKQELEVTRHRKIEQLNAVYERKAKEAQLAARSILGQASLDWPQELFKKIQAKDSLVVALLHNYRQALVRKIGPRSKHMKFVACCDDPNTNVIILSAADYSARTIKLKYLEEA